jgi:hypothetical protein
VGTSNKCVISAYKIGYCRYSSNPAVAVEFEIQAGKVTHGARINQGRVVKRLKIEKPLVFSQK